MCMQEITKEFFFSSTARFPKKPTIVFHFEYKGIEMTHLYKIVRRCCLFRASIQQNRFEF